MKKILVNQLAIGMYVVDTGLSWTDHPLLYSSEGLVQSQDQIDEVMAQGFRDVFIDPERSHPEVLQGLGPSDDMAEKLGPVEVDEEEEINLEDIRSDMLRAESVYIDSLALTRKLVEDARLGVAPDMKAASQLVEKLMGSVYRNPDAIVSLAKLRSFDEYTYTHCINVSLLAVAFGRHLKMKQDGVKLMGLAGLFHDVGKSRIPSTILNKPGRLTDREFKIMQNHPDEGYRMLSSVRKMPRTILVGTLQHHEKFDGSGYPRGLAGKDISTAARLLSLADIYDALTSKRVYKEAMPLNKALKIIYSMRGKDFAPGEVERFIRCLGIFPVGSFVRLSDGRYGTVLKTNPNHALKPALLMLLTKDGSSIGNPQVLDLSRDQDEEALHIEEAVNPKQMGVDPAATLIGP